MWRVGSGDARHLYWPGNLGEARRGADRAHRLRTGRLQSRLRLASRRHGDNAAVAGHGRAHRPIRRIGKRVRGGGWAAGACESVSSWRAGGGRLSSWASEDQVGLAAAAQGVGKGRRLYCAALAQPIIRIHAQVVDVHFFRLFGGLGCGYERVRGRCWRARRLGRDTYGGARGLTSSARPSRATAVQQPFEAKQLGGRRRQQLRFGWIGPAAALKGAVRILAVAALALVRAFHASLVALAVPLAAAGLLAIATDEVHLIRLLAFLAHHADHADARLEGVRLLLLHELDGLRPLLLPLFGVLVVEATLAPAVGRAHVAGGKADAVALQAARLVAATLGGLALLLLLPFAPLAAARRLAAPIWRRQPERRLFQQVADGEPLVGVAQVKP
eukprot:scaffold18299_cov117-Isochrysis_galbana.AAC.6